MPDETLRIAPENLHHLDQAIRPCGTCDTPVTEFTVAGRPGSPPSYTRTMEATRDELDVGLIHLEEHTPARCRAVRMKRDC